MGAAIVPPVMGLVADKFGSMRATFLAPLAALLYISATAIASRNRQTAKG